MDETTLTEIRDGLGVFLSEFDECFIRADTRRHLDTYVRGQLAPLQRKSVEPIALAADVAPRTLQEFLGLHRWDESLMRTRVREIVARDYADPNAVLIVDETSFAKKGVKTVGVQRQHCGTTGKMDNCVQTVHLTYAAGEFSAIIDSDIYIPKSWISDARRREEAGVPEYLAFHMKWQMALRMIDRSRADGIEPAWVTADEFYGRTFEFIEGLEARGLRYVVEIPVITWGWTPRRFERGKAHRRIDKLFQRGGPSWHTYHIKDTTKGPAVWKARATRFIRRQGATDRSKELWLIIAINVLTNEVKYFLSNAPADTPITTLLAVAFTRWHIERSFEDAKQEVGLDHFEVRTYQAVQRHLALSMVSLLFLRRASHTLKKRPERTGPCLSCAIS